jgi:hypothetical protein
MFILVFLSDDALEPTAKRPRDDPPETEPALK